MPEPTEWKSCDCPCDCNDLYRIDENGQEQYAKEYMRRLEQVAWLLAVRLANLRHGAASTQEARDEYDSAMATVMGR